MPTSADIDAALARFTVAAALLHEARMVGAPTDCVAERLADLKAARARLTELGVDTEAANVAWSDAREATDE
jgi:hypothetical protein